MNMELGVLRESIKQPLDSFHKERKKINLFKGQYGQYGQNRHPDHFNHFDPGLESKGGLAQHNTELYTNAVRDQNPFHNVNHHLHDRSWIWQQAQHLSFSERTYMLDRYSLEWQKAFKAEVSVIRKEGAARFAANTWLRDVLQCKTSL